jgi:hypothetical protein
MSGAPHDCGEAADAPDASGLTRTAATAPASRQRGNTSGTIARQRASSAPSTNSRERHKCKGRRATHQASSRICITSAVEVIGRGLTLTGW